MSAEKKEAAAAASTTTEAGASLLDQITSMMPRAVDKPRRDELIRTLVEQSLQGTVQFDRNVTKTINRAMSTYSFRWKVRDSNGTLCLPRDESYDGCRRVLDER